MAKYKCYECEKEFDEPREIKEEEKEFYDCLNAYLDYCCPYCTTVINIDDFEEQEEEVIYKK